MKIVSPSKIEAAEKDFATIRAEAAASWEQALSRIHVEGGTEEQKKLLMEKFNHPNPTWVGMALTEAHCGSDSSAIRMRAVQDGDSWILTGEKLFVTTAQMSLVESDGLLVVWATTDPSAGFKGIKAFIVEANTPGVKITKLEKKLGLRASDTAVVIFEDCRIPLKNLLGGPSSTGFKGAMTTFDSARPAAAAAAAGIPLGIADDRIAILPATFEEEKLLATLIHFDTIVLMKVSRVFDRVYAMLKALGLETKGAFIRRVGSADEEVVTDLASLVGKELDYLSLLIVKK